MEKTFNKWLYGGILASLSLGLFFYLWPSDSMEIEDGQPLSFDVQADQSFKSAKENKQSVDYDKTPGIGKTTDSSKTEVNYGRRNQLDRKSKTSRNIDENVDNLRQMLRKKVWNEAKIMSLAHKMSQGTDSERRVALEAFRKIGGKEAANEILENYIIGSGGGRNADNGSYNDSADNGDGYVNDDSGYANGGGGSDNSGKQDDEVLEAAIDTLKHVIEESLYTGESVMDKPSWLAVLDEMDYVNRYSYLVLLAQFDKSESVPIFLEMYDSNDVDLQALSRLFVSMLANGRDMSDKENATEWLESFAVKEEEDDKVKAD